jgi:cellulose synthase/poly-beta-1,6-N-acetylglucosamine synthase-like glycosyltransferase
MRISSCLESLASQSYPKHLFEVIVVNDHSTDDTAKIVAAHNKDHVRLLNLSDYVDPHVVNSHKKKAIDTAINQARGDLIVTTDADCVAGPDWIKTIVSFYEEKQAAFIAAPVKMNPGRSILSIFQSLDFLILQGITGASVHNHFHNMCNGANLAYEKKAFMEVDGFEGIDSIASGDDMLLMEKISQKYPERVYFLKSKEALVITEPEPTWKAFMNQRIRWASKAGYYKDKKIISVLLLVYLLNVSLLIFFVAGFFNIIWIFFFVIMTFTKAIFELSFVRNVARFFNLYNLLVYFPYFQPLHIFYTVMAGWLGLFGTYQWKERKVR